MPLMIVTEDDWELEKKKLLDDGSSVNDEQESEPQGEPTNEEIENFASSLIVHDIKRGRGNITEVPAELRNVIAEEAILGTPADILSKAFKVSPSSISAYKHGSTSTASYKQKDSKLVETRNRIHRKASNRLISALNALSEKDLTREDAKTVSGIAKDMASITEKISPKEHTENTSVHLHLYAPKMKSVDDYEIVDV